MNPSRWLRRPRGSTVLPDQRRQHHELSHPYPYAEFAHLQQIPAAIRGSLVSDLIVIWAVSILLCQMWTANYAREQQPQTEAFELSAAEREAIEQRCTTTKTRVRRPLKR